MNPEKATPENPIKLAGTMTWIYHKGGSDFAPVHTALIRGPHEMAVECMWDNAPYTVPLTSSDGIRFAANFQRTSKDGTSPVKVMCKLWSNKSGYLLFGVWIEEGTEMHWLVEIVESSKKV